MMVPFTTVMRCTSRAYPYKQISAGKNLIPNCLRMELHRIWIVDANLRDGLHPPYVVRAFIAEDSWQILAWTARQEWRV